MTHDTENIFAAISARLRAAGPSPSFAHLHDHDALLRNIGGDVVPVLDSGDAEPVEPVKRTRKHKPTLVKVARQAARAGIAVARYEHRPDGTIVVVPGKPVAITDTDDTKNLDPKWN